MGSAVRLLFFEFFEFAPLVVIGQLSWSVEDGQGTIDVPVYSDPDADIVAPITIHGDLEDYPLEAHAVVGADGPFMLFTEDVIEMTVRLGDEDGAFFGSWPRKLGIISSHIHLTQVEVGRIDVCDAMESQFSEQSKPDIPYNSNRL